MKYSDMNNKSKEKGKQNVKSSFSKEFTHKYDEIDRLTEQIYSK